MPLWTIEVFTDPSACADRIGGYLGLEKPAVTHPKQASPGFFDDDVANLAVSEAQASERRAPAGQPEGAHQDRTDQGSKEAGGMSADGDTQNHSESQNDRGQTSGEGRDGSGDSATQQPAPAAAAPAGVLPNKAAEDDPRRWGDEPAGYDHDSWLEEQKPPHWG
jgi:hypothetical protein